MSENICTCKLNNSVKGPVCVLPWIFLHKYECLFSFGYLQQHYNTAQTNDLTFTDILRILKRSSSGANYTECKSGSHLKTSILNIMSCRYGTVFSSKHRVGQLNRQTASILKQAFHFPHREETIRMWGVRRYQTKAATTVFLSRTMTYMTDCLYYVTHFRGQAVISA